MNRTEEFFSLENVLNLNHSFGIYNSGGVIENNKQQKGLYSEIRKLFTTDSLDFVATRTQNNAVQKAFKNQFSNSTINKHPTKREQILANLVSKYLCCENSFNKETLICKNVYPSSRNNTSLIDKLESTDGKILINDCFQDKIDINPYFPLTPFG